MVIRRARPEDLRHVQELNHELFLSDNSHYNDLNVEWPFSEEGEEYFRRRIEGDNGVCAVAEQNGRLIGYLAGGWSHLNFSAYTGKRAELENMCVSEGSRGKGVGEQLAKVFYDWCKSNGANYVMVDAFSPNIRAIKFYERVGFTSYSSVLRKEL